VGVKELDGAVEGRVLYPADEVYDGARRVFNAMIDRRPAAIVQCAGADDVVVAVHHARDHELPLSVKGVGTASPARRSATAGSWSTSR